MGIVLQINFLSPTGTPVPVQGTVTITQNTNPVACWTGLNLKFTFSGSTFQTLLNNIGCNPLGCCGAYHVDVHYEYGGQEHFSTFQVTKEYNDSTYVEDINVQTSIPSPSPLSTLDGFIHSVEEFFASLGVWTAVIILVALILGIVLGLVYLVKGPSLENLSLR